MVSCLAFGDLHLKPGGDAIDYDELQIPANCDLVVTNGDVMHREDEDSIATGREFFARLDDADPPVITVPGNHDPLDSHRDLVAGFDTVHNAHETVVSAADLTTDTSLDGHSVVGWGCEQFDFTPEITISDFEALDPGDTDPSQERRYLATERATRLEDAVFGHLEGERDRSVLCDVLDIERRRAFTTQLDRAIEIFDTLAALFDETSGPTLLLTHIPPCNTALDQHHKLAQDDEKQYFVGSLGLKLALRKYRPIAVIAGHAHVGEYDAGIAEHARPHMIDLGKQSVVRIQADGTTGAFTYQRL
jgi:Icc-related predicted phosphoesterase